MKRYYCDVCGKERPKSDEEHDPLDMYFHFDFVVEGIYGTKMDLCEPCYRDILAFQKFQTTLMSSFLKGKHISVVVSEEEEQVWQLLI